MLRMGRPASALTAKFDNVAAMKNARAIQTQFFDDLNYPNRKQYLAFPSYTCMSSFAEQHDCKSILEIGAGLSTAVWANLAQRTDAEICTVDADISRMKMFIRGTRHEAMVSKHVDLIEGVTIHSNEFLDFYSGESRASYGGVEVADLRDHIDLFQSRNCSIKRWHRVNKIAGHRGWSARDLMTTESTMSLPRQLLDLFSSDRNFDNEISFLRDRESRGNAAIISSLIKKKTSWDLVFFDSGELASTIEWTKLKSGIVVGGFAAFHDIFFPKSIKNIIPCAAIMADRDWEIVFCDDSTKQGLLIAQRLR